MGFEWSYAFQKNWEGKLNQFLKNNYNPCIYSIFVDSYASQRMLKIEKRWIPGEWQCTFLMEFENAGLTYIPPTSSRAPFIERALVSALTKWRAKHEWRSFLSWWLKKERSSKISWANLMSAFFFQKFMWQKPFLWSLYQIAGAAHASSM